MAISRLLPSPKSMNLLLNFKEWLTLPEAADHLSTIFAQKISEADVLRLALDGHLRLSVNLVNGAQARRGKVVGPEGMEWDEIPAGLVASLKKGVEEVDAKPIRYLKSLCIDEGRFLNLEQTVSSIWGVWNIPMLGGDRLDVEHRYQVSTGGPDITVTNLEGAFVESLDGLEFCQLQASFDDNEFQAGSNASGAAIEEHIRVNDVSPDRAEELRAKHKIDRAAFRSNEAKKPWSERFYPAGGLPDDAIYVVRTQELVSLQEKVLAAQPASGKANKTATSENMTTKERTTLLTIIGLVAHVGDLDLEELPKLVLQAAEEKGVEISRRTVEEKMKSVRAAMLDRAR